MSDSGRSGSADRAVADAPSGPPPRPAESSAARLRWQRGLPRKRMSAACVLVRAASAGEADDGAADDGAADDGANVLLVRPTYRPGWDLPGGVVEQDESPYAAARREVAEELGLHRAPGRLLALDWVSPSPERTEGITVVYDGGLVTPAQAAGIRLPADELSDWTFVAPRRLAAFMEPRLARRVAACLTARRDDRAVYLQDGHPVG
ncbi:NUDIX hydrolase [Frankia sp. AgB32]|uniref:NUDIX domain-containing protein n=1 Tax=Frankia sp. AgB32 TaxID=631119 RepID=UPI00200D8674|nr:NUDIX hydrolase [Frankia sp. AgB32]MCK9894397.1 NUDIX hydrolase [Frankia sp. AgB32]